MLNNIFRLEIDWWNVKQDKEKDKTSYIHEDYDKIYYDK